MSIAIERRRDQKVWLAHDLNGAADFDQRDRPILSGYYYIIQQMIYDCGEWWEVVDGPFVSESCEIKLSTLEVLTELERGL